MRHFKSRPFLVGGFAGAALVLVFFAACGGGGGGGSGTAIAHGVLTALGIDFDNATSGLAADTLQDAVDELDGRVDTHDGSIGDLDTRVTDVENALTGLDVDTMDHAARIGTLETDSTDHESRITTLEGATISAANVTYSNTTSGLTATDTQAAIDEVVTKLGGGSTFIRWGNKNAPTGTTKLYDGIAMAPSDGKIFVMKGGDAGSSATEGGFVQFVATDTTGTRMPTGVTANKRIVACVCFSSTPTAILYGTHTVPTGWTLLYKGYVMSSGSDVIVVDSDNFDATAANAGTESNRSLVQVRFSPTHDTTNYPRQKNIKACVIKKN